MNKGQSLLGTTIVILAIGLLSFFFLVLFLKGSGEAIGAKSNTALIQQWVDTTVLQKQITKTTPGDLSEQKKLSRPPPPILNPTPISVKNEAMLQDPQTKYQIAEAMAECWRAFDRGEKNFLSNFPGSPKVFCYRCSVIEFDPSLKDGKHQMKGFTQYLATTKMDSGDEYSKFLSNKNDLLAKQTVAADDTVTINSDWYIFFMAFSYSKWKSILAASTAGVTVGAAGGAGVGAIFAGVGAIPGAIVGGLAGGITAGVSQATSNLFSDNNFNPTIAIASPEVINAACNQ